MNRMNEKIYAKAQRSFDHDNERRSKSKPAFAVEKSLFTQFEAGKMVRRATAEDIAEAKALESASTAAVVPVPTGGEGTEGDSTSPPAPPAPSAPPPPQLTEAQKFVAGTIADIKASIPGTDKALLVEALAAEQAKGDDTRQGVVDLLTKATAD